MSFLKSKPSPRPELVRSVSYPQHIHGARIAPARSAQGGNNTGKLFLAVFALGVVGFFLFSGDTPDRQTLSAINAKEQATVQAEPEKPKQLDHTVFSNEINAAIAAHPGMDIGVSWIDIKTGDSQDYGVQDPFVAASTAKLLTAIAFLHDVEDGENTLSEMVGSRNAKAALEAMIVKSDNEAWNDFNNTVMSHQELADYAAKIGFSGYDPDKNTVTPASLSKLLANLYQKRLLDEEHTNLLLDYMRQAYEAPVQFIPNLAPDGFKVYHKPGYLKDRLHDAAIIDNGDRPYVLVIFTKSRSGVYDTQAGSDTFTRIAKASFTSFSQ